MRVKVTDKFELNSTVKYADVEIDDADLSLTGWTTSMGGRYFFTPQLSGGLDAVSDAILGSNSQINFLASLRYEFAGMF
jgi:hypothetical protein